MQKYQVRFTLGESNDQNGNSNFVGQNGSAIYDANSKVHALEQFYEEFSTMEINEFTVLAEHPSGSPLGFLKMKFPQQRILEFLLFQDIQNPVFRFRKSIK